MTVDQLPPTPELLYLLHGDPTELATVLSGMRAADIAEALRDLKPDAAARVMAALPFDLAVRVFDEPELRDRRCEIVRRMDDAAVGPLVDAMSADQQADLFRELPDADQRRLLTRLDSATQRSIKLLLQYAPDTAGGIMTTELVSMPVSWTVDRATLVGDIGERRTPLSVTPHTDREDIARLISKYDLLAVPVIDAARHVIGIVTVDDVIDAMVREQTEDIQKLGGMEALDEPYMRISFLNMIKKRGGWLCALFLSEMLTATAMQRFEGEIAKAVVLSMFIPLVMSSGGNSGSQATSLIIRALALREVRLRDWWRIAIRELPTGLVLGAILGVIGVTRIELWQRLHLFNYGPHHLLVAITVGLALIGIVSFGSLAGSMLPFVLKRFGFDPASASAPFVATLVDVTGLIIYFSVALLVLRGTLL